MAKPKSRAKAKKVDLVTGACGFSGLYMVKHLLAEGRPVRATDLERAYMSDKARSTMALLDIDFDRDGVEFVPADLTDKESLAPALKNAACLYHTASLYDYSAPMEALEAVNIQGTVNLVETALASGVERMIHWSTAGVYGHPYMPRSFLNPLRSHYEFHHGLWVRPWKKDKRYRRPSKYPTNQPFTEESSNPLNTPGPEPEGTFLVNDYSVTKWKQEQLLQRYHRKHGLPVTIIRPAPLYGPGSDYGIGGIIIAMSEGMTLCLPKDLKHCLIVNCHVRDGVRAARFLAERPETAGEAFNIVDDTLISQLDFLRTMALLLGRKVYTLPGLRLTALLPVAVASMKLVRWLDRTFPRFQRASYPSYRIMEISSAQYISSSYWISNRKLRSLGFAWEYPDFRLGLRQTIEWFIRAGWVQ